MNNMTRNARNFFASAIIMCGLAIATGANSQDKSDRPVMNEPPRSGDNKSAAQTGSRDGTITVPMPILMMVPVEVSTDAVKKGAG